jgi:1,2-diacylglycerol 3-beta-glucosyltransferase
MAGGSTADHQGIPHSGGDLGEGGNRRVKATLFLLVCAVAGLAPHWLAPGRSLIPAIALALVLGSYSIRTVLLDPPSTSAAEPAADPAGGPPDSSLPSLDVVVAARDEQAVITRLVERILSLRYPAGRLLLWVIDDGSEDRTPELLRELQSRHPNLNVLRRSRQAGGGKSGALNLVLPQLSGRWLLVLDADADLQKDGLERLMPWAEAGGWAAVQLRKAIVNPDSNLLTRAQAMELAFDAVIQQGRLAAGGIAELRGNGQLLRLDAVRACGGFNEGTVTDDLDLSLRLLLAGQPIGVLWDPPVQEEAVLTLPALWRQRQRWAEGGLQRFLDYAPGLVSDRLNGTQKADLLSFFVLQYMMPVMAAADLLGVLITGTAPAMWPFSIVALGLSGIAIASGCRRRSEGPPLPAVNPASLLLGVVYLVHWFAVIPWVTLRMALLPKRLVWAKTLHHGAADDLAAAFTEPLPFDAEAHEEAPAEHELAAEGGPV